MEVADQRSVDRSLRLNPADFSDKDGMTFPQQAARISLGAFGMATRYDGPGGSDPRWMDTPLFRSRQGP